MLGDGSHRQRLSKIATVVRADLGRSGAARGRRPGPLPPGDDRRRAAHAVTDGMSLRPWRGARSTSGRRDCARGGAPGSRGRPLPIHSGHRAASAVPRTMTWPPTSTATPSSGSRPIEPGSRPLPASWSSSRISSPGPRRKPLVRLPDGIDRLRALHAPASTASAIATVPDAISALARLECLSLRTRPRSHRSRRPLGAHRAPDPRHRGDAPGRSAGSASGA